MSGFEFSSRYLDRPLRAGRVWDLFMPEKITSDTAIFWVHGGGWNAGGRAGAHCLLEAFGQEGFVCATTDYRLNVNAFEQLGDIRESYCDFLRVLGEKGLPRRVAVYGTSAGGHLASLLAWAAPGACGEPWPAEREWGAPVKGIFSSTPASFEPWPDIFPAIWSSMQRAAGTPFSEETRAVYRKLSPERYIGQETPPVFFMEAECEHMFWPDRKLALAERMAGFGTPVAVKIYPRAEHGFFYALERPQQRIAFEDAVHFLRDEPIAGCAFAANR